jgi:opacity protein-like surface antigen
MGTFSARYTCGLGLLVIGICAATPARAQVEPGFELSPYVGAIRASGGLRQVVDQRRRKEVRSTIEEQGTVVGLRGAYNANRVFGLDFAFIWATNRYLAERAELGRSTGISETTSLFLTHGNIVAHLAPGRVVPYATGGLGILGTVEGSNLAFNVGGGLKVFATSRVAARLEFRRYFADVKNTFDTMGLVGGRLETVSQETYKSLVRLNELSAGLSVFF